MVKTVTIVYSVSIDKMQTASSFWLYIDHFNGNKITHSCSSFLS